MDEATLFKFGKWVGYGPLQGHPCMAKKFPLKGASSGSRGPFENFKLPSVFLEWVKLRSLNLASGSTTACPTQGKKFPRNGCGLSYVTDF